MYICTYLCTHLVLSICRCIQFDVVHMYMHLYRCLELYVYVHASVQMFGVVCICTYMYLYRCLELHLYRCFELYVYVHAVYIALVCTYVRVHMACTEVWCCTQGLSHTLM